MYIQDNFKIFFKKQFLNTNLLKKKKKKKMVSIKTVLLCQVLFEAVYIMAKPLSPKTQPRLCEVALNMHLKKVHTQ